MKHLKRIFESNEISLDQIKDIFQDLSDIVDLSITDEYFAENYDESLYTVIQMGDGNDIERIGYLVHIETKIEIENFRLISDIFDCLDKSIQLVKSFDPSMEIYIRKMDDSIIPDIYLIKEENKEEIANHTIEWDVNYIVDYINNIPSKNKMSKNLFSEIIVSKEQIKIIFTSKVEDEFLKNFEHMWMGEVNSDCKISRSKNKIIIDLEDSLF